MVQTDRSLRLPAGPVMPAGQAGYSLIEVVIVLAMISIAMIPIFQSMAAVSRSSGRAADQAAIMSSVDTAIGLLSTLNPVATPDGRIAISGGRTLEWQSTEVAAHPRSTQVASVNTEIIRLFEIEFRVSEGSGRPLVRDTISVVGWGRDQKATARR